MLGKTHITLGIASALIITRPDTVTGVLAAITGGSIGGWIADIDRIKLGPIEDREDVVDVIISALVIFSFIFVDFLIGAGMSQYVKDNWGIKLWGALLCFLVLMIIGYKSKHRDFTHSFLCMALFGVAIYYFCRPVAIPFVIGYLSHLIADLFNKRKIPLLFPLPFKHCLNKYPANGKVNRIIFWVAFALDVVLVGYLFSFAVIRNGMGSLLIQRLQTARLFGLNTLQMFLLFVNTLSYLGYWQDYKKHLEELATGDYSLTILEEFGVWILNLLLAFGGGIGLLVFLLTHHERPIKKNGHWWAFCYTSILGWFTIYCYVCNPFNFTLSEITWLSKSHIPLLVYLFGINIISGLLFYKYRNKPLKKDDIMHTRLVFIGALGGTVGGFIVTLITHHWGKYFYAAFGFPFMFMAQIFFIIYMMSAGVF